MTRDVTVCFEVEKQSVLVYRSELLLMVSWRVYGLRFNFVYCAWQRRPKPDIKEEKQEQDMALHTTLTPHRTLR